MVEEVRFTVRLPKEAVDFLDCDAKENFTSRNAEIVRSIRERMERVTVGQAYQGVTPRHQPNSPPGKAATPNQQAR